MLKLERIGEEKHVQIHVMQKKIFADRPFWRAFLYSFLFHLMLFLTIRVQFVEIFEPPAPPHPIEVALDSIQEDETHQAMSIVKNSDKEEESFLAPLSLHYLLKEKESGEYEETKLSQESLIAYGREPSILESDELLSGEPLTFSPRVYPLHLRLSSSLSHLQLVEDGSILFKEKSKLYPRQQHRLPSQLFPISYHVKISPLSGKVIEWKRKKSF